MSGKTLLKIKKEMYILSFSRFFEYFGTGMMVALIPLYIARLNSVYFQDVPVVVKVGIVMSVFGAALPSLMGMLSDLSLPNTKGRVIGMHSTIRGIAFGSGPLFGGAVAMQYGYTAGFYLCAVLGTLSLLLVSLFIRETHNGCQSKTTSKISIQIIQ